MSKMLAIARRDMGASFGSPIAWVVMAVFAFVTGLFFVTSVSFYQQYSQQILMQSMGNPMSDEMLSQVNVVEFILVPIFGNASVVFLLMIPALTMRLVAEEKKTGTDELLFTAPLTVNQIVIGKFLAGMALIGAVIATTLVPIGSLFLYGTMPWKIVLACYAGLFLLGAAFLSLGLFASSITENQIVAAVLAFAMLLSFFVIGWTGDLLGDASQLGKVLAYISITAHYEDFTKGIVDSVHAIYFLSLTFLGLFLTSRVVESRRWR